MSAPQQWDAGVRRGNDVTSRRRTVLDRDPAHGVRRLPREIPFPLAIYAPGGETRAC